MKIYIGADHGGFALKGELINYLTKAGYEVEDEGNKTYDPDDDYPQFATRVVSKILSSSDKDPRGILICKGAQGMAMAANRHRHIRASVPFDVTEARMTRNDNDSNVLCLSARMFEDKPNKWQTIVDSWLETPFSQATRHRRRVAELDEI
jgi:ribose 5-phosphate isomerase B